MNESYPCFTTAQMAEIPEDIWPDFIAELPDLLRNIRQIQAASETLAFELKRSAPWPWRLFPLSLFTATIKTGISSVKFVNDKKGTITLSARVSESGPTFYSRTEKLDGAA